MLMIGALDFNRLQYARRGIVCLAGTFTLGRRRSVPARQPDNRTKHDPDKFVVIPIGRFGAVRFAFNAGLAAALDGIRNTPYICYNVISPLLASRARAPNQEKKHR